ncbi:putative membrane protein YczE [Bacillus sp. J14TS2]|uniref:YczE/YyaS/YitT family protein n=1 Tax=Bacillus sp. J14TS2 TaxID=2807188 RepID=UPI001B1ACEC3|nr:YitT family protein [Bacillus sp. J14TS2]GIN71032.1 putative membrane protein YczE [Bacillus sp. J14TS2]
MKNVELYKRFFLFVIGLLIMSFGIVLMIISNFGVSPWDVLHVGLYYQLGLTIGTWSILIGFIVLGSSSLLMKRWPKFGAYLNMILVGLFIDMYMKIPFLIEPDHMVEKFFMFFIGMIINAYGMGIYLSAEMGAGPRDSFMLALQEKTGWKIATVRRIMEVIVLAVGWILGGPVFYGTIIFSLTVGTFIGFALPQCQFIARKFLKVNNKLDQRIERSAEL